MPSEFDVDNFPYETYRDYISNLSAIDNAYQRLGYFLGSSPDAEQGPHIHPETQVPRSGTVTIADCIGGRLVSQQFLIGDSGSEKDVLRCIHRLDERPVQSDCRLVLLSYHRDPFTSEFTGVNTDILDAVGRKYNIHPEVLMWHFGSDYGLDKRFFHLAAPPLPSALSSHYFCHLRNDHSLFSCCLHSSNDVPKANTVVMFSRNYEFPNWNLLISRLVFLESKLPIPHPAQHPTSRWSDVLYMQAVERTSPEICALNVKNPIEFIIPYAQMVLINATFVMDMWAMKVMHPQGKTSSNLEVHYDKQVGMLNEMRLNFDALKAFNTSSSSSRWEKMLMDYERVLKGIEEQINVVLAQKMTYRAAMASLDESRMGIEHAKRSIEQNARVKRLTQLALIFIPLSFSTSLFGMNLDVLGTGTAKAWMVIITIASAYGVTCLLWVLIDYQNVKFAWQTRSSMDRWPIRIFSGSDETRSSVA